MKTAVIPFSTPQLPSVTDNLTAYVNFVNTVPPLSAAEERLLADKFRRDNDKEAAHKLALSNLRLVVAVAYGYRGYGLEQTDLIQEGNIGLLKAIRKFDPKKGARLATFAMYWIKAEIYEFIVRNWRIVKIATTKAQRKLFFNMRKLNANDAPRQKDDEIIAKELDVDASDVREMRKRIRGTAPVAAISDEESFSGETILADDSAADPEVLLEENDKRRMMRAALGHVGERERDILTARYLTDPPKTLQSLATKHNVSVERVRQIETAAIKKLATWVAQPKVQARPAASA